MANVDARGSAVSQPCSGDEFDNHVPVVEAERLASSLALHRVEDRRTGRYAHEFLAVTDERGGGNNDHQVAATDSHDSRSEEHTSELQSLMRSSYAVFCLKKK